MRGRKHVSITIIIMLVAAGFFSGAANAIAGGGTFLTFAAMTFAGLPPIAANATSAIVQFPGYITSALAYRAELRAHGRGAVLLCVVSVFGSLAGALFLLSLSNPGFRQIVPWLLLAATVVFAAGPFLRPKAAPERPADTPLCLGTQFLNSIYGGFFGAGMGIMMLAVLGLTTGGSYHHLNALKNLLAVVIAAVAIVVFTGGGVIAWPEALMMIPASALGGFMGVRAARLMPHGLVRLLVTAVGLALSIYYFVSG